MRTKLFLTSIAARAKESSGRAEAFKETRCLKSRSRRLDAIPDEKPPQDADRVSVLTGRLATDHARRGGLRGFTAAPQQQTCGMWHTFRRF
jgi:hypothetical protein